MSDPRRAAVLLVGVLAGAAAGAQPPTLSLEATPGFSGYYKVGSALPVRVTAENRGADWRGEIRAGREAPRLSIPVTLPSPSKKSFFFTLPAVPSVRTLELRLADGERTAVAVEAPLRPLSAVTPLFVAVSERTPAIAAPPAAGARLAFVRARDLPEDWRGYGPADGVILEPASAAELRPAQHRALADWLLLGGRLVLSAREPARLRQLLDVMSPSAAPTAGSDELRWGRGSVRLTTAPAEPRTVAQARQLFDGRFAVPLAPADRGLLRQAPVDAGLRPRPAPVLVAFFLVYWLAVVVALTRLSRPPRHPLWSLGALLGLAAVFTLALGGLGRIVHQGRVPYASVSLVHVFAGADESFVTTRGDLVSAGGELRIEARLRAASFESGDGKADYRLEPDGRTTVSVDAPLWSRRRVWAEGFVDAGFRLAAARIVNRSRLGLSRCRLLTGSSLRPLGDVPAGESLELGPFRDRPDPGGSGWLERVLSAYRMAGSPEGSGGAVLCSAAGELSVLSADRPFDELGAAAVVVFHLPEGWR